MKLDNISNERANSKHRLTRGNHSHGADLHKIFLNRNKKNIKNKAKMVIL